MLIKLKNLFYRIKYSNLKNSSGAVGVIFGSKKSDDAFSAKLDEIARTTAPCYKTNDEVLDYIREKYNLTSITLQKSAIENYKVNYIMNNCPEVLTTPEYKLLDGKKSPSRKQMQAFQESSDKRFREAFDYPIEKLGLEFEGYSFTYTLSDGYPIEFMVIAERTTDRLSLTSSINRTLSESEQREICNIGNSIDIYKGVTQKDIDSRTKRFIGYAASVIDFK